MGYSQEDINKGIIYRHRLCDRMLELISDVRMLDKSILLGFSEEELIELGKLMLPVFKKMQQIRKKRPSSNYRVRSEYKKE